MANLVSRFATSPALATPKAWDNLVAMQPGAEAVKAELRKIGTIRVTG